MSFKTPAKLLNFMKKSPALRNAVKSVFSKKGILIAGGTGVLSYGAAKISEYISENTGCFLFDENGSVCKMKDLSCCQQSEGEVPPCTPFKTILPNACDGYDEKSEDSCCRRCDCQYHDCLPTQSMECRKPTVGDALSYFQQNLTDSFLGLLPMSVIKYFFIGGIILLVIVVIGVIFHLYFK